MEKEITALLRRFAPAKVPNVPSLLKKYKGREDELLGQIRAKYAQR